MNIYMAPTRCKDFSPWVNRNLSPTPARSGERKRLCGLPICSAHSNSKKGSLGPPRWRISIKPALPLWAGWGWRRGPRGWLTFRCFITEPQSVSARSFYIHRSRQSPPSKTRLYTPQATARIKKSLKSVAHDSSSFPQDSALGKICPIWGFEGFSVLLSDFASRRVSLYSKI